MWLTDLRLILPDRIVPRGALYLEHGRIAQIIEGDPRTAAGSALSLAGLTAMPGIVDLHGDMLERDIEPRPSARFPTLLALYELDKRLAAAGITTAFAAVSFAWTRDDLRTQEKAAEIIRVISEHKRELMVDFLVHARFEVTNSATGPVLKALLDQELVQLVSVMDHTPGQGQYKNVPKYVDFMTRWLGFDPAQLGDDIMSRISGAIITKTAAPRDWDAVRDVTETARQHGIIVASHDDDTVEKVSAMHDLGVTISEFPVSLEGAREARRRGMHVIMGAPNAYRGVSTSEGNLSARDALRAGLLDILATDYFPASMFHAALLLAAQGELPLHESIRLVSQNPAEAVGLHDRGCIEVGRLADLVLFDDRGPYPRVRATLRHAVPIFWDNTMAQQVQAQDFRFTRAEVRMEESLKE